MDDRPFKEKLKKAHVHTWLAWQEEPGTPMGLAITKKYLKNVHSEPCLRFISWIRRLYGLDAPLGEP
jgi:hypothetical protein